MEKVCVIAGAGRGLGQSVAVELAGNGWDVAICARNSTELVQTKEMAERAGGSCLVVKADASKKEDVDRFVSAVKDRFGRIDGCVCCVGKGLFKPAHEAGIDDWNQALLMNATPVFLMNTAVLPQMIEQGSGGIVNISSRIITVDGDDAPISAYRAAKAAVEGYTRALAGEVRKKGINVCVLAPGPMDTEERRWAEPNYDPDRVINPEHVARLVRLVLEQPHVMIEGPVAMQALNY